MDYITELYCLVDDFWQSVKEKIDNYMISDDKKHRGRQSILSLSEMTTLVILFHSMRFRQFKKFYQYVSIFMRREFPRLLSYNRFIKLMPRCIVLLTVLFDSLKGSCSGVSVVDSTPLVVCDNLRISRHKVFDGYAERGKSSTGWFFGFKLHVIINHPGEIISARLTAGNVDDRKPVPDMASGIFGDLFGDKGYLSNSLKEKLKDMGINLITKVRRNMKKVKHTDFEKAVLSKRAVIETVFDELKNLCQIEHSRHRSINNFIVNLLSGLVAYCLMDKKLSLSISTSAPCVDSMIAYPELRLMKERCQQPAGSTSAGSTQRAWRCRDWRSAGRRTNSYSGTTCRRHSALLATRHGVAAVCRSVVAARILVPAVAAAVRAVRSSGAVYFWRVGGLQPATAGGGEKLQHR